MVRLSDLILSRTTCRGACASTVDMSSKWVTAKCRVPGKEGRICQQCYDAPARTPQTEAMRILSASHGPLSTPSSKGNLQNAILPLRHITKLGPQSTGLNILSCCHVGPSKCKGSPSICICIGIIAELMHGCHCSSVNCASFPAFHAFGSNLLGTL